MNSKTRLDLRNPIIQRVRRHATVATMFRKATPVFSPRPVEPDSPGFSGTTSRLAGRVSVATLLPALVSLPTGHVIGFLPATSEVRAPVVSAKQPLPVLSTQPERAPTMAPETRSSPVTLPEPQAEGKTDDTEWRRLQTIVRKHEEKRAVGRVASQAVMPIVSPVGKSELHEILPAKDEAGQPQYRENGIESIPHPAQSGVTLAPRSQESPAVQAQNGPPLHQKTMDTTTKLQTLPSLPIQRSIGETQARQPASVSESPIAPPRPTDLERHTEPTTVGAQAETASSDITASTPPGTEEPSPQSGPPAQQVPLQAVWPVQRMEEHKPLAEFEKRDGQPHISASVSSPEPAVSIENEIPPAGGEVPGVEKVKNILRGIASGQPTGSSIEVISPRRPRPAAPSSKRQPPVESGKAQDINSLRKSPSPVQMRQDGKFDVTPSHPSEQVPDPAKVHTGVGPLPADLWRLLGQSPPPDVEPQAATDHDAPVTPVVSAKDDVLVQRQPEAEAVKVRSLQEMETETMAHLDQHRPAEKLDTDELACRVYAEIKHRLAVEWERLRGRF